MIKIDLLKGKGIPHRARPVRVSLTAALLAIPISVVLMIVGGYISDGVILRKQQIELFHCDERAEKLIATKRLLEHVASEHIMITDSLREVAQTINSHKKWSPVMDTLAWSLPEPLSLNKLKLTRQLTNDQIPSPDDPEGTTNVEGFQYVLQVVTDPGAKNELAIREFLQNLCSPGALASEIEDTKVLSKWDRFGDDDDFISYTIDCFFKIEYLGLDAGEDS